MLSLLTQVVAGPDLRETWRLADLPEAWVIVLLVLPGVFLLSWLGYRHQGIAPRWRFLLEALAIASEYTPKPEIPAPAPELTETPPPASSSSFGASDSSIGPDYLSSSEPRFELGR